MLCGVLEAISVRRRGSRCDERLDLTTSVEPTLLLLQDTRIWRQRLVETFTYRDAAHVRVTSSYQVELHPEFLQRFVPSGTARVNLLVPITTRLKQPLIRFDVEVSSGIAFLLPRRAGSEIQMDYLMQLIARSRADPCALAGLTSELLYAICWFTDGTWREFLARAPDEDQALSKYLADGLRLPITRAHVGIWREAARAAGAILSQALAEPPRSLSASENVLLALPDLNPAPNSVQEVKAIIDGYVSAVRSARDAGYQELLSVLAEYGRRWEVIIEAELPVNMPAIIRLVEDRPTGLQPTGDVFAELALGDAASVHFEARVDDPNVALGTRLEVVDLYDRPVGVPLLESARLTDETLSIYSSAPDRPYYVRVVFSLQPSAYLRAMANGVLTMTISAIGATLVFDASELTSRLALVLLPSTFAVAFVLTREDTPLAARLQSPYRRRLAMAVGVLWLVTLGRLLGQGTVLPEAAQAVRTVIDWIP